MVEFVLAVATLVAAGIEAAYVPTDDGGGDYLVRVEPDLLKNSSPYQFSSDVPADSRDVRRVRIFVGDNWPPAVERAAEDSDNAKASHSHSVFDPTLAASIGARAYHVSGCRCCCPRKCGPQRSPVMCV